MKTILIVDGGPRRNMNTAALCDAFEEGARGASPEIEVRRVRLYDLAPYKGCVSCLACKLKGKLSRVCRFRDPLLPVLEEASAADGLALASPVFMADRTAALQAFVERIVFPWLNYADGSVRAVKRMPVAFLYTMNATPEQASLLRPQIELSERLIGAALGETERVEAYNTYQVRDYSRYEFSEDTPAAKQAYRDAHWESDLAAARAAGRRTAEKALAEAEA